MALKAVFLSVVLGVYQTFASNLYDLDSPFTKTAIIEGQYGKSEEREVLSAKIVDKVFELVRPDGSLTVVDKDKVKAILPKLPSPGLAFSQEEAKSALAIIVRAKESLPGCPETSESVVTAWNKYASEKSRHEINKEKATQNEAEAWIAKYPIEKDDVIKIDSEKYLKEGQVLLEKEGVDRKVIQERLSKIQQLMSMDLSKVQDLDLIIDWDEVSIYFPMILGLWFVILILWAFFNASNVFTAVKLTVESLFSGHTRIAIPAKIILWISCCMIACYLVIQSSRKEAAPMGVSSVASTSLVHTPSEKALYLSLNSKNKWSSQGARQSEVSSKELLELVFQKIKPKESETTFYRFGRPEISLLDDRILWVQPVSLLKYQLQLRFEIPNGLGNFAFENMPILSCHLGALPLGGFLGEIIFHQLEPSFANFNDLLGIRSGSVWSWRGNDRIVVNTPEVVVSQKNGTELSTIKSVPVYKKVVSSQELAEVFAKGYGSVYMGQYVEVWGGVVEVSSGHRLGNNLSSEIVRNTLTQSGGPGAAAQVMAAGSEDLPDAFFLSTGINGQTPKVKVKCLVKSPLAYFLDTRGDLYTAGQNPTSDASLLPKGTPISFEGGRVESFERNTVEIYGCVFPTDIKIPPEELTRREKDMEKSLQILSK
jgi:hypothetical protein